MACGTENRPGRKFCAQCAAPLGLTCAKCGTSNESEERFCGECGAPLVAGALSISVPAPSPPPTAEPEGERKQLTVLFADVQGSMDLQEDLDPEAWAQIMARFVQILAEGVRRFGGTVDQFTGDGIMALFGAPVAQEDHARRACHAAWHLTSAIAAYAEELRRSQGVDLHVRLGLNSGEVVLGRVGGDVRLDPAAFGHTVGLAQRMEALAQPGRAYLTEHTARLVEGWFRLEDLGPMTVKGARESLRIFVLEEPAPLPPTLRGGLALGTAPLVGRDQELAFLDDVLAAAADGHAQVVGVVGEAGVGKSRLCEEFARSAAERGITVRRTTGVSHAMEVPLLPILSLMRDYFSVTEADTPSQAREKIAGRLVALDPGLEDTLPLVFDFMEVPDPERPAPRLAPEVRLRRFFEALRRVTQRRSERETLVLLLEDLHWFDAQSLAFVERLIPSFPGTRTLVLTNFRPEFSAPWARHSYYRQLPVDPLDVDAVGRLLDRLLGNDASLSPLCRLVAEQTGGNPFFVEEVVRSLVEDGTLAGEPGAYHLMRPVKTIGVPPTVQATLAARIDRLEELDKSLLQSAAVIGRNFAEPVLRMASALPEEEIAAALGRLCGAEFLQEVALDPVEEYRFWHPLTQDVVYGSLLRERRAALHGAVAVGIIATEPDRLDERAALVASHFERAGNPLEAARWNDRAGGFALRSDVGEAMRRWRAALVHLDSAPKTDEALRIGIRARQRLIRYGARTGMDLDEAGRLYAAARPAAERLQDATQLASVTFAYGSTAFWRGAVGEARDLWLEAARLSDQTDDADAQASYWAAPPLALSWTGPVSEGLRAVERVVTLCGGNAGVGVSVLGFSVLMAVGVTGAELLSLSGRVEDARAALDEALAVARARGEAEWIAWALSVYPRLARTPEEFEASLKRALEAVRIAEDSGNTSNHVLALGAVGIAEVGLGRFPEAAQTLSLALAEAHQHQVALFVEARLLAHLARTQLGMDHHETARQAADEAVEVARLQGARVVECLALLTRAQVGRATGAADKALLADLDAALALVKETGALTYEPFIHEELGRLQGDEGELREALRLYSAIGATGHARRLGSELTTWSTSARPAPNTHLGL
jgi:adenylate cyclase